MGSTFQRPHCCCWVSAQYLLLTCPHRLHAVIYHTPPPPFYCYFSVQCFSGSCRCEALGLRKPVIISILYLHSPYTVSTYQELFHCMNTAFLVEADSQACIGVHFNTARCCLVILCTPRPYLPPFPILHPAPSSSPAPSPQPHTCHNHFFCCLSFPPTTYFTATVSSFPPLLHLSLSLRAQRRFVAGDQSGEAR